jgi:serine/threonine protein kinase
MAGLLQLSPGSIFAADFRVVRAIAEGGMGSVYEVEQLSTGAARALKIMHPQLVNDERLKQRFVQEAKVGALIESDHVVTVVGAGIEPQTGTPWLAMELLRGETLASLIARRGSLALWEVREIFVQLCHALTAAHNAGIVHRDLKPENIFLGVARREGIAFTVKVLDFGIAKLLAEAHHTHTAAIGTPLWMAPEQTEVGQAIRPATDVWPLGLIAFYLLTGFHYWRIANAERLSAAALLREVVLEPIVPPSERAALYGRADRVPAGFDAWFARCVCRDVDQRFQDARQVREGIEQVIAIASSAPLGLAPALMHSTFTITGTPQSGPTLTPEELARGATLLVPNSQPHPISGRTPAPESAIAASPHAQSVSPPLREGSAGPTSHPSTGDVSSTSIDDEQAEYSPVPSRRMPRGVIAVLALVAALGAVFAIALLVRGPQVGNKESSASTSTSTFSSSPPLSLTAMVLDKPCPPGMAAVSGGTFYMSSVGDHVKVAPFCLDVHEVTAGWYADCVKKGNCTTEGLTSEPFCNYGSKPKDKHPINCVDWDQSAAYCLAQSKRLPKMEEWEWAARGADKGTTYPWGDEAPSDQLCWSAGIKRSAIGTCEVGSHPAGATPFGIQDLAGNVSEWTDGKASDESVRPLLGDHWSSEQSTFTKDVSGRTSVGAGVSARKQHRATVGFRCAVTP